VHGDGLSLELSLGATRVLVDAGVGTYEVGPDRSYARSTAAHNTVGVGAGTDDQHELWASHRIGARARTEALACAEQRLVGRVHGHDSPAAHRRTIEHQAGTIVVTDVLEPPRGPATVRYFVAGACPVVVTGETAMIEAGGRRLVLRANGMSWHRSPAPGWVGMGRPAARVCLSLPVHPEGTRVELRVLGEREGSP
jgi:hypothetical protein